VNETLGGRYTLRKLIARGGMGEVWSAEDSVLGRRVAVKVLLPNLAADPGFAARFKAEARAMARLSDPGIVEVYDYGQAGGMAYLVMQFVDGESLHALVSRVGALPPERAMVLLAQAADAIHSAHAQGIVHRDVKPGNLLLRPDGHLVLTDFGIARMMAGDRMTAADEVVGTASYLAPEQVTGGAVSPGTDVYALGVVAYELLTQRKPFEGETPMAVALQHVHAEPRPLPETIPQPVRHVVMRALAKDPADRWPSAAAMARAADRSLSEPVPPPPPPTPQKNRLVIAGVAVAVVAAAGIAFALTRDGSPLGAGPPTSPTPAVVNPASSANASTGPVVAVSTVPSGDGPSRTASRAPGTGRSPQPGNPPATSPSAAPSPASTKRTVPNMYSWTEAEARSEMNRLGLVADITYKPVANRCSVVEQTPTGGTVVETGSTVDIVVAKSIGPCEHT
jgi:serine/threonine-protein kinase